MIIGVREKQTDSWLDPRCNGIVGFKCGRRLWNVCQGRKGLFLTLTYKRDDYRDAQDLYRKSSEEQHVPLFLRKVARALGRSLKGKWFCKLEFQQGGWVHWHIIILDIEFASHAMLTRCWGKGHVWVKALTKKRAFYCCKYVTKDGSIPAWIYFEKPRTVKVVRVSPGFWGEETKPKESDPDYEKYGPPPPQHVNGYVPIGIKHSRQRTCLVRVGTKLRKRIYDTGKPFLEVITGMLDQGARAIGTRNGWLMYKVPLSILTGVAARGESERGPERLAARREPPLHLSGTGNPDARQFPPLIDRWFREEAELEAKGGFQG